MVRTSLLSLMRTEFSCPDKSILQWFPGHMNKGMKQMEQKLKTVDCVVEVHDARIPTIGRNSQFKYTITGLKPHILVLNKRDLADRSKEAEIVEKFKSERVDVVYTNCRDQDCSGLKKLKNKIKDSIMNSNRFNRNEEKDLSVMIIGIPNVGKSSLINTLRNTNMRKASVAPVGAVAGITRSVSSKIKISENPLIYVLDSPGILNPKVENTETALKLALCSSMQDHLVGIQIIADYLLYYLNKIENYSYVEYLGIKEPTDNIMKLLILISLRNNRSIKRRNLEGGYTMHPDVDFSAHHFVRAFRDGSLGRFVLE